MKNPLTFIDLFCGCGGFSLGLTRAGFKGLAAIDFNREAIQVFQANFKDVPQILERDLTAFSPAELETLIGTSEVDLIVGGPPCQGFSTARQVDGANHGERLKDDPTASGVGSHGLARLRVMQLQVTKESQSADTTREI